MRLTDARICVALLEDVIGLPVSRVGSCWAVDMDAIQQCIVVVGTGDGKVAESSILQATEIKS